jgi:hypothetical protein
VTLVSDLIYTYNLGYKSRRQEPGHKESEDHPNNYNHAEKNYKDTLAMFASLRGY